MNDYLDSSIDKIANSLYLVGICLVYFLAVWRRYQDQTTSQMYKLLGSSKHRGYRKLIKNMRSQYREREKGFNRWVTILYFVSFLLILAIKLGKSGLSPLGCSFLYTVLSHVILLFIAWLFVGWFLNAFRRRKPEYFKNDFADIILLSVFLFFSSLYLDAQIQIAKIKQKPATVPKV